jgi:hypothetical protein
MSAELQLFGCVRRIRNQLTNEYLVISVKRVDDDLEKLTNLGLEDVLFRCGSTHGKTESLISSSVLASAAVLASFQTMAA